MGGLDDFFKKGLKANAKGRKYDGNQYEQDKAAEEQQQQEQEQRAEERRLQRIAPTAPAPLLQSNSIFGTAAIGGQGSSFSDLMAIRRIQPSKELAVSPGIDPYQDVLASLLQTRTLSPYTNMLSGDVFADPLLLAMMGS